MELRVNPVSFPFLCLRLVSGRHITEMKLASGQDGVDYEWLLTGNELGNP